MKSRIFTPHDVESETAIAALNLRNPASPLGMGALTAAILAAATVDLSVAVHSNGVVESFSSRSAAGFDAATLFDDLTHERREILGSGEGRSKILATSGSEYTVEIVHDDNALALNAVANLVSKPQPPTYTVLSLVNDICDKLDEILLDETDGFSFTKWSVIVNQADQSVVVLLHNGFKVEAGDPVSTFFGANGLSSGAAFTEEYNLTCIDRFVGTIPTTGGGDGGGRPSWE